MMNENLLEKLEEYGKSDFYPLHMPGHKRRISHFRDPFDIDITEIDGFDNLFHAQGALLEAQRRAARLYGAEETYYLVNGSSSGILAAISASVKPGGRILMARNSHKAAYHGVFLRGLHAAYLYPETDMVRGISGSVDPKQVEDALDRYPDIQAVLITSPTYDGVASDIAGIAEAVHRAGAALIVDGAHGAHFGMHPSLPKSALDCGADIVINSVHKTLPSLTQTALLHVNGPRADRERLRRYLGIYQSSSPSYVLMAGIDGCISLLERQGRQLFDVFWRRLEKMRRALETMRVLHLVDGREPELTCYKFDPSKVLISTERSALTGLKLGRILRQEYHLELEMEAERYVTAIMTIADTQEGFDRLEKALLEIDSRLEADTRQGGEERESGDSSRDFGRNGMRGNSAGSSEETKNPAPFCLEENEEVMTMAEAEEQPWEATPLKDSAGRVSAEYAYLYPPGIPLLIPGERIPESLPGKLSYYQEIGLNLQGLSDYDGRSIRVLREENRSGEGEG